jgi:hypothetical protein
VGIEVKYCLYSLFCLVGALFFFTASSAAAPFMLNRPVTFETAYPAPDGKTKTQVWKVSPSQGNGGAASLVFRPANSPPDSPPFCKIQFEEGADGIPQIRWTGAGGVVREGQNGMLLMGGFPVACDILPLHQEASEKTYSEKTKAGERTFVKSMTIRREDVSPQKARREGWIRGDVDGGLLLFTAEDDDGELIVRQLWSETGSWWLYEETPFRQSWRVQ